MVGHHRKVDVPFFILKNLGTGALFQCICSANNNAWLAVFYITQNNKLPAVVVVYPSDRTHRRRKIRATELTKRSVDHGSGFEASAEEEITVKSVEASRLKRSF